MQPKVSGGPAIWPWVSRPLGSAQRWVLASAAAVAAVAHVPVIAPHLREAAAYMGALFIVLTVGCVFLAGASLVRDSAAVYALAVLTCGLAVIGYVATRLIAFPMLSDDVGNWLEPLGIVSIVAETIAVAAALFALAVAGTRRPAQRQPERAVRGG